MKILSVVGAMPNFVKIASIGLAIEEHIVDSESPPIARVIVHNQLVGRKPDRIIMTAKEIFGTSMPKKDLPLLWDGKVDQRIIRLLVDMHGALPDSNVHAEKAVHHKTSFPTDGPLS